MFKIDNNKIIRDDGKANKTIVNLFKNHKSKNWIYMLNIRTIEKFTFLTSNAKKIFNHLK